MLYRLSAAAGAICLLLGPADALDKTIAVSAPASAPSDASKPVDHAFASFSLPAHFFADFTGNRSHPNLFSRDILDLLHKKTGAHPYVRVGGTSTANADLTYTGAHSDRVVYNASQEQAVILSAASENGIPAEVLVGPSWFEGFGNFPGSLWNFQANLGRNASSALDNTIEVCGLVVAALRHRLIALEIGNEPDLYPGRARPANYTVVDYVREWTRYANAISRRVLRGNRYGLEEWRFFQGLVYANETLGTFSTQAAFDAGVDKTRHLKSVSLHQSYTAGNQEWVRLQDTFMNHTAVQRSLGVFRRDIDFLRNYDPSITFLLGETNSDYVNLNMAQVEGVFGSALWLIDYLLYGMTMNIARFNLIQGVTFGYTGWVPVPYAGRDPYVRPPLYGQIVVADAIGRAPDVRVKEVDLKRWDVSAYAVYESRRLAKYVLVNLDEWNATTTHARPTQRLSLEVPRGVKGASVKRLTGDGASADEGIAWAGLSWNYTDGRLAESGRERIETVKLRGGKLDLELKSSEAVLVTLHRQA
ncbi:glycoside hydrolase family 79 [Purpureocillium lavendulum]|uniref:Glycoside hydrolase family 79 n=1 Tax=Purpureocillium lavendulum TaxID=1247861 RepID=A0AB34G021_9HYPO|nr:glycoside hydrolase family 79 [Purpureocillium lavendulum]